MTKTRIIFIILFLFVSSSFLFSDEIHQAAQKGELAKVEELLKQNPQVVHAKDETGRTPLHWAARGVHFDVLKLLIENGADVNARDNANIMALHSVAARGHQATAELLITHGADLTARDVTGNTPLSYAVAGTNKAIVDLLQRHGVKIPLQGEDAQLLLHSAASSGYEEFVDLMLAQGVDFNLKDSRGGTLLHSAVDGGNKELVVMLLNNHHDVNAIDRFTITPIHIAAFNGNTEIIQLLAEKGADLNARTTAALTPLYFAQFNNKKEAAELLVSLGADQNFPKFTDLTGTYFGQNKPGKTPEPFATGIISSLNSLQSAPVFSPDGRAVYWSVFFGPPFKLVILFMKMENGRWTVPQIAPFSDDFYNFNPIFSPDGKRLYFISNRPLEKDAQSTGFNNWYVEQTDKGWSGPKHYGFPINSNNDWGVSIAKNGNLYFASSREGGLGAEDIYRSRLVKGNYTEPENLGLSINTRARDTYPFISPDENYLLFISNRSAGEFGGLDQFFDIYISFCQRDGSWTSARRMGNGINSDKFETTPLVSPDGKYLFFVSQRNGGVGEVYWADAAIIDQTKKEIFNQKESNYTFNPYLGQKHPGVIPEIFAPGIVSSDQPEHGYVAISPNGKEIYWSKISPDFQQGAIWFSEWRNGCWTEPKIAPFSSAELRDLCPVFSTDGCKLYFTSMRPIEGKKGYNLWVTNKNKDAWEQPIPLSSVINHGRESGCSVTVDGSLYFMSWQEGDFNSCDIYFSQFQNGQYLKPEPLASSVNSDSIETTPFISADGSYLLFSSRRGSAGFGGFDLYVSFKRDDNTWSEAINLGSTINSQANEWFPSVSPDGKYIFYNSGKDGNDDVYWVDAKIVEQLRPQNIK